MIERQYPLFVYGTLMSTQRAYQRFADVATHSISAWLDGAVLHDLGPYPMLVRGSGRVYGELHWLQSDQYHRTLQQLDQYEGGEYERRLHPVLAASGELHHAWVYFGESAIACHFPIRSDGRWWGPYA